MIDDPLIRSTLPFWLDTRDPATDTAIAKLIADAGITFPPDYIRLLCHTDGGETFLGDDDSDDGSYFVLWPTSDVLVMNAELELSTFAPSYFAFGTNGGGELFAFDSRLDDDAVFMLPMIGLSDDAGMLYCNSFARLLTLLPVSDG